MNGMQKIIGREKSTKKEGTREIGTAKTQLEIVEVENASHCLPRCSLHYALII